jgi:hypothetical protein
VSGTAARDEPRDKNNAPKALSASKSESGAEPKYKYLRIIPTANARIKRPVDNVRRGNLIIKAGIL